STGVLNRVKDFAQLAKKYNTLVVVDGVCSVAGEELRMDDWGVDVAFTASQKAVGVPPGLALAVASQKAMQAFVNRASPVASYYSDWSNWLPIMQAYEGRKAAYFGTPAVNLVNALDVSLQKILREGLDQRLERHQTVSRAFKTAMQQLGLRQIPCGPEIAANTMTAPFLPENVVLGEFLGHVKAAGVVLAGGLLADRKNAYFRVGHMGIVDMEDTLTTIAAIETGLQKCGYLKETGVGTNAALAIFNQKAG
ncbi:MAG: aminotransferase class V-fold PLP-dependent enzyme, partial [Anaerolineaceae bacterium]